MPLPAATPNGSNLLLGKGSLYFNLKVNGALTGYRHLGNVESFDLMLKDEVLEKSSGMNAGSPLYKSIVKKRDAEIKVVANEFTAENVALALMGTVGTPITQTATAITGETLTTNSTLGRAYRTAKIGPITAVTVTQSPATALVLNTDYAITDANLGIITLLPGSTTITPGSTITISYTPTAYTSLPYLTSSTSSLNEGAVMFVPDPTFGPKMLVEVWSVSVRPDAGLGLIAEDWGKIGLVMSVMADTAGHPLTPLYQVTYLPY